MAPAAGPATIAGKPNLALVDKAAVNVPLTMCVLLPTVGLDSNTSNSGSNKTFKPESTAFDALSTDCCDGIARPVAVRVPATF